MKCLKKKRAAGKRARQRALKKMWEPGLGEEKEWEKDFRYLTKQETRRLIGKAKAISKGRKTRK